ncbi:hypothetical protein [Kribbella endophytica]
MLILIQLVTYVVGVLLLLVFGWIADQLSRPPTPPRAQDEAHSDSRVLDQVVGRREQLDASLQVSPLIDLVSNNDDKQHCQGHEEWSR